MNVDYEQLVSEAQLSFEPRARWGVCGTIAKDLQDHLARVLPDCSVSQARGFPREGSVVHPFLNHFVTVVREPHGAYVALDATRPSYDGEPLWIVKGMDATDLERKLSILYSGHWSVSDLL